MNPSVGIILLNWNDYKHTSACLDSLEKLDYENYKSIVVDNNSRDDSLLQLIQTYPNVHFIQNNQNLGFTGGNNVGIRYALKKQFEHILLLNNDTIVEPDFLRILVNKLESDPKIGAVQPKNHV